MNETTRNTIIKWFSFIVVWFCSAISFLGFCLIFLSLWYLEMFFATFLLGVLCFGLFGFIAAYFFDRESWC